MVSEEYFEGYISGMSYQPRNKNPYNEKEQKEQRVSWETGWNDGLNNAVYTNIHQ